MAAAPPYSPSDDMKYPPDLELRTLASSKLDGTGLGLLAPVGGDSDNNRRHSGNGSLRAPFHRWVDGFRRFAPADGEAELLAAGGAPPSSGSGAGSRPPPHGFAGGRYYDAQAAARKTASTALSRDLKGRHLQMIAIGGSIGTGLFVASGMSLSLGGPASVLLAYMFIGVNLYCTVQALGEMAVAFPVAGSFSAFSTRFLDPSWGFSMGWNYALQWLVVLPLEIIAASFTIGYWDDMVSKPVFITVFLVVIVIINLFGIKGYGEAEFVFSIIKVTAVIGFILLGIVINIGGTKTSGYIGGRYWQNPGAFNNGFKGFCSTFVSAAFAFAGTELVGLAAAETANPRKSLPTAIKQVFWRITLFYVVALMLVGLLVPYNEPRLLSAQSTADVTASPFVIAIETAGITILPSVMNCIILVAVISVGNSSVFGSSRTLAALAEQGQAPRIFAYVDRRGRPLVAIFIASSFGLLAYLSNVKVQSSIFNWLLAISSLSTLFTWGSICLSHIRFRKAWAFQNRSLSSLAYRSQAGVVGSWIGLSCNVLIVVAQFWIAVAPLNPTGEVMSVSDQVQNFFFNCMAVPIVVICWLGHKLWYRTSIVTIAEMDVVTGGRDPVLHLNAREREEKQHWPTWKKVYKFLC